MERVVEGDRTPCVVLGLHWVVSSIEGAPVALRLARDPAGEHLVPTEVEDIERQRVEAERVRLAAERERVEAERARAEAERERDEAQHERDESRRRIAELEGELRDERPGCVPGEKSKAAATSQFRGLQFAIPTGFETGRRECERTRARGFA